MELASQLLSLLDGGPALGRAEAVRVLEAAGPKDPATPALAVLVLGWLEAAEQVLAAGPAPGPCWAWPGSKSTWASGAVLGFTSAAQGPWEPGRGGWLGGAVKRRPFCYPATNVPATWPGTPPAGHGDQ